MPRVDVSRPQVMTPSGFMATMSSITFANVVTSPFRSMIVRSTFFFLCKTLKRVLNIRPELICWDWSVATMRRRCSPSGFAEEESACAVPLSSAGAFVQAAALSSRQTQSKRAISFFIFVSSFQFSVFVELEFTLGVNIVFFDRRSRLRIEQYAVFSREPAAASRCPHRGHSRPRGC